MSNRKKLPDYSDFNAPHRVKRNSPKYLLTVAILAVAYLFFFTIYQHMETKDTATDVENSTNIGVETSSTSQAQSTDGLLDSFHVQESTDTTDLTQSESTDTADLTQSGTPDGETANASDDTQPDPSAQADGESADSGENTENTSGNASATERVSYSEDRVVYKEGFFYQSLTDDVKARINGKSYKDNCTVPYEKLRYVSVLYVDFNNNTQVGEIVCNKGIAQDMVEIFYELYENQYQIDKIRLVDEYDADDDLSCADNNTSCFNFRVVEGSNNLSKHALGLAIDINPFQNPYVTYPNGKERISPAGSEPYADRKSGLPHMITEDDLCYKLFKKHGFKWGGQWKSLKDYQHFQKEL